MTGTAPARESAVRLALPFLPVGAALFCIQLDFFSLTLALPTIAADLGTTVTDLQWLLSGYMIALGSSLVPAGRIADVVGRRRVLLLGVAVFGGTSLVCGLASSVPLLVAARVAQGVGAGMIFPTALSLVSNATDASVRPRIMGVLLGIAGVGTALGPVVGGLLASTAGWRWVFLLNVPVAAFTLWGGRRLADSRDDTGPDSLAGFDWLGVGTIVGGVVGVSLAIDDLSTEGWTAPTVVPLVLGVLLLVCFALVERRAEHPLVRPSLLRERVFVILTVAGTFANIGAAAFILCATLDLQQLRGLSAATAGLLFFFSSIGLAVCGPLSGWLTGRYPAALIMGVSLVGSTVALALLAVVEPLPLYVVVLSLCGLSTGMGYALGQIAIQQVLPPARSAEGSGVFLTSIICIGGMGVVACSAVIEALGDGAVTADGISTVLLGLAAVLLAAGVATLASGRRVAPSGAAAG